MFIYICTYLLKKNSRTYQVNIINKINILVDIIGTGPFTRAPLKQLPIQSHYNNIISLAESSHMLKF